MATRRYARVDRSVNRCEEKEAGHRPRNNRSECPCDCWGSQANRRSVMHRRSLDHVKCTLIVLVASLSGAYALSSFTCLSSGQGNVHGSGVGAGKNGSVPASLWIWPVAGLCGFALLLRTRLQGHSKKAEEPAVPERDGESEASEADTHCHQDAHEISSTSIDSQTSTCADPQLQPADEAQTNTPSMTSTGNPTSSVVNNTSPAAAVTTTTAPTEITQPCSQQTPAPAATNIQDIVQAEVRPVEAPIPVAPAKELVIEAVKAEVRPRVEASALDAAAWRAARAEKMRLAALSKANAAAADGAAAATETGGKGCCVAAAVASIMHPKTEAKVDPAKELKLDPKTFIRNVATTPLQVFQMEQCLNKTRYYSSAAGDDVEGGDKGVSRAVSGRSPGLLTETASCAVQSVTRLTQSGRRSIIKPRVQSKCVL